MSLTKLQRPIGYLAYGSTKLASESEHSLADRGVRSIGDFLWRFGSEELPEDADDETPSVLAILAAAARFYLVKAMPANLAVGLVLSGVTTLTSLADFDLDELQTLVGDLQLEHPPSSGFLAGLQVEAARAEDKGHVWGRIELADGGEGGDPYAWSGARRADMGTDGFFALLNLSAGEVVVHARAQGLLEIMRRLDVQPQALTAPVVLRLPPESETQISELQVREHMGGPVFGVEVGRNVYVPLRDLPDDTYLSLNEDGTLVNLLRLRRGLDVLTEIVDEAELPPEASAGDVLRYQDGRLTGTDLTLAEFGRLKASLPDEVW